jgi:hypothetical protein
MRSPYCLSVYPTVSVSVLVCVFPLIFYYAYEITLLAVPPPAYLVGGV